MSGRVVNKWQQAIRHMGLALKPSKTPSDLQRHVHKPHSSAKALLCGLSVDVSDLAADGAVPLGCPTFIHEFQRGFAFIIYFFDVFLVGLVGLL